MPNNISAIIITATQPVVGDQTVDVAVTGSGITTGDYTIANATITLLDGQTSGQVDITITDDGIYEGTETAVISIVGHSAGVELGNTISQNLTIIDNETAPITQYAHLSWDRNRMSTSEGGNTGITLTVSTGEVVPNGAIVQLAFTAAPNMYNNGAIFEEDFTCSNNPVVIYANWFSATTTITAVDDVLWEGYETFTARIVSVDPPMAVLGGESSQFGIYDNESGFGFNDILVSDDYSKIIASSGKYMYFNNNPATTTGAADGSWTRMQPDPAAGTGNASVGGLMGNSDLSTVMFTGNDGTFPGYYARISHDSCVSWQNTNRPYTRAVSLDGTNIWTIPTSGNGLYFTGNGGAVWAYFPTPFRPGVLVICSPQVMYASVYSQTGRIWKTINGGGSWTIVAGSPTRWWSSLAVSSDGTKIYACGGLSEIGDNDEGAEFWISTDSGDIFLQNATIRYADTVVCNPDGNVVAIDVAPGDTYQYHTLGITSDLHVSVDYAGTFARSAYKLPGPNSSVFPGGIGGKIRMTPDGGKMVLCSGTGIYTSDNGGGEFLRLDIQTIHFPP